ncbi:MAG: hypothetical protein RIC35_11080 [Marinoscillum sp.]
MLRTQPVVKVISYKKNENANFSFSLAYMLVNVQAGLFYNNNFYTEEELSTFLQYVEANTSGWNSLSLSAKIFFRMMKDN